MYKDDGSDVPERIKGLSAERRRQFAAVWNSVYDKCGGGTECETSAYEQAYGVIKKYAEVAEIGKRISAEKTQELAAALAQLETLKGVLEYLLDWAKYSDANEADFGAKGGKQIKGGLWRAQSGKFSSGPSPEELQAAGVSQEISDGLLALADGKEVSPEVLQQLQAQGLINNLGKPTKYGLAMQRALKNKDMGAVKKLMALNAPKGKAAKGGKGGGGGKDTTQIVQKAKNELMQAGVDVESVMALRGNQTVSNPKNLIDNGLAVLANGKLTLTTQGQLLSLA